MNGKLSKSFYVGVGKRILVGIIKLRNTVQHTKLFTVSTEQKTLRETLYGTLQNMGTQNRGPYHSGPPAAAGVPTPVALCHQFKP